MGEKQYLIMLDMDVRKRHYHIAEAGKITNFTVQLEINVDPNVAKAGGLQSQASRVKL